MIKFYTAFLYSADSTEPHCTHKYLGRLSIEHLADVVEILGKSAFSTFDAPEVSFDTEQEFGPSDAPVRVLTASIAKPMLEGKWAYLRQRLDRFNVDEYTYTPHVTTEATEVLDAPFTHYALCAFDRVIAAWPLKGVK